MNLLLLQADPLGQETNNFKSQLEILSTLSGRTVTRSRLCILLLTIRSNGSYMVFEIISQCDTQRFG